MWDKRYRKKKDIVTRQIAGETLLVPVRGKIAEMQKIFALNPVAHYVWEHLDGEKTMADIRDGILQRFAVGKETADTDIQEFLTELVEAGLVEAGSE